MMPIAYGLALSFHRGVVSSLKYSGPYQVTDGKAHLRLLQAF